MTDVPAREATISSLPVVSVAWWRIHPYPVVFPAVFVVLAWATAGIHPALLTRPLVVTVVVSIAITLFLTRAAGDRNRGAILATLVLVAFILPDERIAIAVLALAAVATVVSVARRGRPWRATRTVSRVLAGVAVILGLALVLRLVGDGVIVRAVDVVRTDLVGRPHGVAVADAPDIVVMLLDGFPGERAMAIAGGDPRPFLDALVDRGFTVQADSHSNYLFTTLTLASMLSMTHVHDQPALDPPWGQAESDPERLREAINGGAALDALAAHGYELVSIAPGFDHAEVRRVDRFVTLPEPSEFEFSLLRLFSVGTWIDAALPDLLSSLQRQRILATFGTIGEIAAEPHEGPRFLFAHVPAPHAPWVFDANGGPRQGGLETFLSDDPVHLGMEAATAFERSTDQVTFIGEQAIRTIDDIIAHGDPRTVLVLMSDHGTGIGFGGEAPTATDLGERFSNLMAVRAPDQQDLIEDRLTPVNVFPRLLGRILGDGRPGVRRLHVRGSGVVPRDGRGTAGPGVAPVPMRFPRYPIALAWALIVPPLVISGVSPLAATRVVLVTAVVAAIAAVLGTVLFRDRHRGGIFAILVVIAIMGGDARLVVIAAIAVGLLLVERYLLPRSARPSAGRGSAPSRAVSSPSRSWRSGSRPSRQAPSD